jgi:hypothetical protein
MPRARVPPDDLRMGQLLATATKSQGHDGLSALSHWLLEWPQAAEYTFEKCTLNWWAIMDLNQ